MKCIYLRTNTVNGKQYVGQTNDMKKRDYQWFNTDMVYAGTYITNARNKYGTENFKTEILKECDTQEELNQWEQYYIKELNTKYPNGYNLTDGGYGRSGYKMTEEQRLKMCGCGNPMYGVHRFGEDNPWYGEHHTEESKKKMSEAKKGFKHSEESKQKMSEERKGEKHWNYGNHWSEETKKKLSQSRKDKTKIYQYTLDGELVKVWDSQMECARNGFHQSNVWQCCNGLQKTHKGYKWSYTKKEDTN